VMRAIGYTKRLVVVNFALEAGFVSALGIVIGTAFGVVVGYQIWDTGFRAVHFPFLIPWEAILLVGVGTFVATMLVVVPAARGANKVSPAEVLRFE
jgi:ABC-type antimicrobial peptide transport system permease subunit